MNSQQEIPQQVYPLPSAQVPAQPPTTNINKFPKVVIVFVVLIIILFGVGASGYIIATKNGWLFTQHQPLQKQNTSITPLNNPSPSPVQSQSLVDKVVYAVQKGDEQTIYASDYNGNQTPIATISAVVNSAALSPDRTKLIYGKKGDSRLYMHDFSQNKDLSYILSGDSRAHIGELKWNPNNNQEVIFILFTNPATIKVDPKVFYHQSSYPTINQLGLLNVDTGVVQMIDLSNTPIVNEINLPALKFLGFYSSSKPFLYIFEQDMCAPGPCYDAMYYFDWQTHSIKKFQLPESGGELGGVNSTTGEFLWGDHGLDILGGDQTFNGRLRLYNPANNSIKILINKTGYGYSGQDVDFIDDHTILYSEAKLPQTAQPSVRPPLTWHILDLDTNTSKQIPYTNYGLKPLSQNKGLIQKTHPDFELSLFDFTTGVIINLYKSDDTNYFLLQSKTE